MESVTKFLNICSIGLALTGLIAISHVITRGDTAEVFEGLFLKVFVFFFITNNFTNQFLSNVENS